MMTKKTMAILSVFMIVALTAVGFAAWLIVGTIEGEATGSFVSNELQDKYFKVSVDFAKNDDKIAFGRPEDTSTTGSWLTYSTDDTVEKLTATATITFTPDAGFAIGTQTMQYYLTDASGENYRTIRVAIDVEDLFTASADEKTSTQATANAQWFDWAVQLGYIQYPTVEWISNDGATKEKLTWATATYDKEGNITAVTPLSDSDTKDAKFSSHVLYLDLSYGMFTVDTTANSATYNKVATAQIKFTFNWGNATSNSNPYTYFVNKEAEGEATVAYYLNAQEDADKNITYSLAEANTTVDKLTDTSTTIRNKDLAQRMLDYLYKHLNYTADDEGNTLTGVQFSIALSEGESAAITSQE